METDYLTIRASGNHELEIKKSRFIGDLGRVTSEDEAKAFIAAVTAREPKATHHCWAYLIGEHDEIQRESDNGEPSGTAGVPILTVLQRNHLHNVIAVVTRYFGGIKLGAGGLIRAYSNSTSTAIEAVGVVKLVRQQAMTLTVDYPNFDRLNHYLTENNVAILDTSYTDQVAVTIAVDLADVTATQTAITNLLSDRLTLKLGDIAYNEVPVEINASSRSDD
ncbi:YigZ family protein [Levilactobacillus suantsaiihabitans]|uniref:YigZ family protein n=1 Tax=Levilactobacillus suantsaiihabitans TaxID=2487722 RepID=A0A4Z0JCX3_9LACO|nr:YigZ family protein [Levilactobacillus suantsaiihabitans]TGD19645.1 YigZ family protein [Levilactobacillus suantsaiihabitans]